MGEQLINMNSNINKNNNSNFGNTKHKWRTHCDLCFLNISAYLYFFVLCFIVCNVHSQNLPEVPTAVVPDAFAVTQSIPEITELHGGKIMDGQIIWKYNKSPYLLREDLIIEKDAELIVEKGVEVRFGPMIGVTVRGRLTAEGDSENKIVFTSVEEPSAPAKDIPEIRLVGGPSIIAGRVQLLHRTQWRSVCTNSRNWTIQDMETACRQLGFQGGKFFNWFDRQQGRHPRLLYEEPKCTGTESDIFHCDWKSRQLGSGVCEYHPDLGIECLPRHENDERSQTSRHWRGLRFEAARHERLLTLYNTLYVPTSMSSLKFVVVKNAGVGRENNATSAIQVLGVPPIMENIEISRSAYNGINVTLPNAPVVINNCLIRNNRGHGIYINSTYGMAFIENCTITENGGDGIKHVVHEINPDEKHDRTDIYDFCTLPSTASQTFPIQMSIEQSKYSNAERDCYKYFYTRNGHVLTLSFVKILTNRNDTGFISVYDGNSINDKVLASFSLRNHSRPQSVTSTRNKIYVRYHAQTRTEILGFLRLSSGLSKIYDLKVTDSVISDNNGRGVAIENLRSQIHIHRTSISNNNHVGGLQIVNGVGDVNVTESRISFNQGDGINITTTGGNRNISRSTLSSNSGYGVAIWINNTKESEYIPFNQTTVVQYSEIFKNLEIGIIHGNYCRNSWINITGNWFNNSLQNAIDISSCWEYNVNEEKLILQIGHNRFVQSTKIPIKIQPAINLDGRIEYNHFENGLFGAILIKNQIDNRLYEEFEMMPATFLIQHNQFYGNKGQFIVNLGLSPYSDKQYIMFTRNYLKENRIQEPFEISVSNRLLPRSRVAAVIVLSSSNIDIYRNIIHNTESQYEIGSHLEDQSKILNCTFNWLGFTEEDKIFNRLFHRKDRYNLAKIIYLPYLLHSSNPGATQINYNPMYVPQFNVPGTSTVGGEVDGIELLKSGEYVVERDINIRPGGKLILQSGVTLKFPPSVGMMVAGKLDARGRSPNDITFTLKQEIIMPVENDTYEVDTEHYEGETEVVEIEPVVPIRLLGGRSANEGRLQVRIDGHWGTVCNYRWTILNAALVCHQLGLALNPNDWYLERNKIPNAGLSEDVILSNVECDEFDTDITSCKAERLEEFENSCTHELDVGIKCYETSWAGVRFGVLSERADLQFVNIEKAGLLDYATNMFKPALQIDFARHGFESIRVSNNYQDGLGILYSDLYSADAINTVKNSEFSNNRGSGISFKQLGLKVHGSVIENNFIGISHNPHLTAFQQRELAGWFTMAPDINVDDSHYSPIMLPTYQTDISLENGETRYIVTTKYYGANIQKTYNIKCNPGYVIGMQLLNPIHNFSTENICVYDSQNINEKSTQWCLDRDLSVFPTTSSSFGVVLTYESGKAALGSTVLVVSTLLAPVQDVRNKIVKGPIPTLTVTSTKIKGNVKGIQASYYNRYLNELGDHFLRKANETLKIFNCEISHNTEEAIYINTPFWDIHESNITEITLMINNSLITDNGRGIYQFARDLRSSNNLYHYVLQDNSIERNHRGGFEVNLPYAWQYNENFTHSVYLNNNTWRSNNLFGFSVDGHFASVNISRNIFSDNLCETGLISIKGMEKKMKIDYNRIERNNGQFMVEFRADSQSEILGEVKAVFVFNDIKHNKFITHMSKGFQMNLEPSSVIIFGGIQKVNLKRNLIGHNSLLYDLVAGIKTAKINNLLDVLENWWGSNDEAEIKKKIFDFDDWNNHAVANFRPYLVEDSFESSVSVSFTEIATVDLDNLGGRLTEDLVLFRREAPYIVKSDITVMPGVTLTITAGVHLEFTPNVGILVMGTLVAQGVRGYEIEMKPLSASGNIDNNRIERRDINNIRQKRQLEQLTVLESIRLCSGIGNCSSVNDLGEKINEGFWEYFNKTTLQWVPMCDSRFTERNAQVVCRELGFDPINVYFDYDRRIEYHSGSLSRIWSWPEPLQCKGTESRYEECPIRLNGQLYGHRHECKWDSNFIFIHCGQRNLESHQEYWGGIRFANPEFEYTLYEHRIHDIHTHETVQKKESVLEFVNIVGAGILHNEKSPAIQSIVKSPRINFVNITKSAFHAINLISPSETMNLMFNHIHDSLGTAISSILLTGEGRESDESSFSPLKALNLPYNLFSMIDICDTSKEITIEERVLVYYKYDNNPVNCVKIFNSVYRVKPFGFRLLQFNLFNHTKTYGKRDSITLYDGDIYNITAPIMGYLESDSLEEKKLFKSKGPSMSIKLFANGASSLHGFIAEIITLPISAIGFNRDVQHNISFSGFSNNRQGALTYYSVGEVNPIITVERNEFVNNCEKLYGNFTTCESALEIDVQNTQTLYFRNNLVRGNEGGLYVRADSRGSATSLKGWIHNNLFYDNRDLPCLKIEGRQSSPYQEVIIYRNYFTQNKTPFKDVIVLRQVVSNFTMNYVHSNRGMRILEVSGFDKVRLPIYQTTSHNGFYGNYALDREGRATVVAGTAGQHYVDNVFFNPDNDYEMITVNRSSFVDYNSNLLSQLELWRTKIDAAHNYWGFNETYAVSGRIRDRSDNPLLLEVEYMPYYMNNASVLNGKCPPGWDLYGDTCYMFVGAPMTYREAREFCLSDNTSMPYITGNYPTLWQFLRRQYQWYQYSERVWVQHIDYVTQCTAFSYQTIEITDCEQKNPFLCEMDPKVLIDPLSWKDDVVTVAVIGVLAAAVLFIGVVIACWYSKSKHRQVQRLERRNSIRQSLHSVRSMASMNGGFADLSYRRKVGQMSTRSTDTLTKDYKKMLVSSPSMDSVEKSQFNSSVEDNRSYDIYEAHNPNPNMLPLQQTTFSKKESPKYSQPLHNLNSAFDLAYKNEGFRDNSTLPSGAASINTVMTEETPIIHHPEGYPSTSHSTAFTDDDTISPQSDLNYFNSDTLPLRGNFQQSNDTIDLKRELERDNAGQYGQYGAPMYGAQPKLSFLKELKHKMPDQPTNVVSQPTTFGQRRNNIAGNIYYEDNLPSPPNPPVYNPYENTSAIHNLPHYRTQSSMNGHSMHPGGGDYQQIKGMPKSRSKSEALLETSFDDDQDEAHMTEASRSHSQPLETAM